MKISQVGIDLIKSFEGCSLKAYKCPAGVWTIGYGETGTFTLTGQKICKGLTITQEQADKSFAITLSNKGYEKAVNNLGIKLNQNQFDALVSFCYNLGTGIFKGNLLNALKKEDYESVANQILLYNKARVNGVLTVLRGLDRRRKAERSLFLKECVEQKDDLELAAAVSKTIKSGVHLDYNQWKRLDLINLNNVPVLLLKLGGIDKLTSSGIISDNELWTESKYNANHVRSLLIKYASKIE